MAFTTSTSPVIRAIREHIADRQAEHLWHLVPSRNDLKWDTQETDDGSFKALIIGNIVAKVSMSICVAISQIEGSSIKLRYHTRADNAPHYMHVSPGDLDPADMIYPFDVIFGPSEYDQRSLSILVAYVFLDAGFLSDEIAGHLLPYMCERFLEILRVIEKGVGVPVKQEESEYGSADEMPMSPGDQMHGVEMNDTSTDVSVGNLVNRTPDQLDSQPGTGLPNAKQTSMNPHLPANPENGTESSETSVYDATLRNLFSDYYNIKSILDLKRRLHLLDSIPPHGELIFIDHNHVRNAFPKGLLIGHHLDGRRIFAFIQCFNRRPARVKYYIQCLVDMPFQDVMHAKLCHPFDKALGSDDEKKEKKHLDSLIKWYFIVSGVAQIAFLRMNETLFLKDFFETLGIVASSNGVADELEVTTPNNNSCMGSAVARSLQNSQPKPLEPLEDQPPQQSLPQEEENSNREEDSMISENTIQAGLRQAEAEDSVDNTSADPFAHIRSQYTDPGLSAPSGPAQSNPELLGCAPTGISPRAEEILPAVELGDEETRNSISPTSEAQTQLASSTGGATGAEHSAPPSLERESQQTAKRKAAFPDLEEDASIKTDKWLTGQINNIDNELQVLDTRLELLKAKRIRLEAARMQNRALLRSNGTNTSSGLTPRGA
ncbi:hypothetical protein BS50DRAFT_143580 [Corynespora cassiicola Philippines]|uniref:Uncharacterized protein n=1 Tax=Corynespora cassiicola Philippines TaxID=1448308 RepID=A0A2T2N884_CORCC|nr:hypothetical protein BS50DRAFT_143580 [Corynespora cassiicola Philippines]